MIELKNLSKSFSTSDGAVDALKNVSLTINDAQAKAAGFLIILQSR